MDRGWAIPLTVIATVVALASVATLLLVVLAYGLGSLLGRWLALTQFELTALSFLGLLAFGLHIMRTINTAIATPVDDSELDDDEIDYWHLGAFDEDYDDDDYDDYYEDDDYEDTATPAPPARSTRRKGRRRK